MGLFDHVEVDESIDLPEFEGERGEVDWQTKTIGGASLGRYRITKDGRLHRRENNYRDKTEEEMQEEAEKRGYDSWEEWEADDEAFGPLPTWERAVDETWWADHNQHGSFEFHSNYDGVWYSFEARFTKGDLDEIILLDKHDL